MSYSDAQLRDIVEVLFKKFDKDNSKDLDRSEVADLLTCSYRHMNKNQKPRDEHVQNLISALDSSHDGKISKPELFNAFKMMLTTK